MPPSKIKVNIYTDGSSKGNPGPGGFGVILESPGYPSKEHSQGYAQTTNNRMELKAVIEGLKMLKRDDVSITVYSDSKYVVDSVEKGWVFGWQKKNFAGKKNPDLWMEFLPLYKKLSPKFVWIKGHNEHPQNERCDTLAVEAASKSDLEPDRGYMAQKENQGLF